MAEFKKLVADLEVVEASLAAAAGGGAAPAAAAAHAFY